MTSGFHPSPLRNFKYIKATIMKLYRVYTGSTSKNVFLCRKQHGMMMSYHMVITSCFSRSSHVGFNTCKTMLKSPKSLQITAWKVNFVNKKKTLPHLEKHACQNMVAMKMSSFKNRDISYWIVPRQMIFRPSDQYCHLFLKYSKCYKWFKIAGALFVPPSEWG